MSRHTIVSVGLFALDMVVSPQGKLLSSGLGGSAGNISAILAKLGWVSTPIASFGNDGAGHYLMNEFERMNVDLRYASVTSEAVTPVIYQHQLQNTSGKTHCFSFSCPICGINKPLKSSFCSSESAESIFSVTKANVLYIDRPTKLGVELAERYRKQGTLIVFEPSSIGSDYELFSRILRSAHIVKYADDRLADLTQFSMDEVAVEICTMGVEGLRYRAPSLNNEWMHLDAFQAPWVVDTSGAGDWCSAGMIYHLFDEDEAFDINRLSYNNLSRALRFGQSLSALNCMTLGARGLEKLLSTKKIMSTGQYLRDMLLKSQSEQVTPDSSWLGYELIRGSQNRKASSPSSNRNFNFACCSALS